MRPFLLALMAAVLAAPPAFATHPPPPCPVLVAPPAALEGFRCRVDFGHDPQAMGVIANARWSSVEAGALELQGAQAGVLVLVGSGDPHKTPLALRVCYAPPPSDATWECPVDLHLP